ncbi:MAG: hypothetical protein MZU84_04945 [Sphingobacterium sp.]|nr:hypothetical protein [Sphingobacterium sp.]
MGPPLVRAGGAWATRSPSSATSSPPSRRCTRSPESGPEWYRYELTDSLAITAPGGRRITVYELDVAPRRKGGSLLTGRLWVDAASAEVVRFCVPVHRHVAVGGARLADEGRLDRCAPRERPHQPLLLAGRGSRVRAAAAGSTGCPTVR